MTDKPTIKQASYETMQKEWNEAKNEIKELKVELAIYKQLAYSFETSLYNALSKKEVEYIRALKTEKEVIRNYLGCDKNQTILERLDQFQEEYVTHLQALQEIKELAESVTGDGSKCENCQTDGYCADCEDEVLKQIIQKCEVIDE